MLASRGKDMIRNYYERLFIEKMQLVACSGLIYPLQLAQKRGIMVKNKQSIKGYFKWKALYLRRLPVFWRNRCWTS
ncbi:MAG: hypothetical protein ACD_5C00048G0002 [uncultured bacterium]|nr:MAG: hypothetical protein ACD_5C00048G0002 [uncultured bacterium]